MASEKTGLVIVGGGIVGLSTAMAILGRFPGLRLTVLEKESHVAAHQTGHNSGVIHSGVYYKPGSLKAKLCVRGAEAMVAFCREHGLPHNVCGKVIVACDAVEAGRLEEIHRRARENGVPGVERIGRERLREIEPHAEGLAALHVPTTGVVDFASVARRYAEIIAERGGQVRTGAGVTAVRRESDAVIAETTAGVFHARYFINCAGLYSDRVARMSGVDEDLRIVPFRGEYYELVPDRRHLVRTLIYPVPDPRLPFLGVHFTTKVSGGVEAGPNAVLALRREGYRRTDFSLRDTADALSFRGFRRMALRNWRNAVSEYVRSFSRSVFVGGLQRLVPEIQSADLAAGGSGVRAQAIDRNGALVDDFRFVTAERMIHVLNVPSPAATASLLIGEAIADMATKTFGLETSRVQG